MSGAGCGVPVWVRHYKVSLGRFALLLWEKSVRRLFQFTFSFSRLLVRHWPVSVGQWRMRHGMMCQWECVCSMRLVLEGLLRSCRRTVWNGFFQFTFDVPHAVTYSILVVCCWPVVKGVGCCLSVRAFQYEIYCRWWTYCVNLNVELRVANIE